MKTTRIGLSIAAITGFIALTVTSAALQTPSPQEAVRPIEAGTSLWTEELTWMEVRDAVKAGNTTVLIGMAASSRTGPTSRAASTTSCWPP